MAINDGRNGRNGGWRKYFKVANTGGQLSPISGNNQFGLPGYDRQRGGDFQGGTPNDFAFHIPKPVSTKVAKPTRNTIIYIGAKNAMIGNKSEL